MLVLGISGGIDPVYEQRYVAGQGWMHDSAAVLLDDGKLVAAIEEERLNRIKHTNKAPICAIRYCLDSYGVRLKDIDKLAFYADEQVANNALKQHYVLHAGQKPFLDYRTLICQIFSQGLGEAIDEQKLVFVDHHVAHALSAFIPSGYDRSLVLAIDASGGNGAAGMVLNGEGTNLQTLRIIPESKSVGNFYLNVIRYLGYHLWDEYKVMGLAPYGHPERFRNLFKTFYELLPDGDYAIHWSKIAALFDFCPPRASQEPITQTHKDVASALQEALEDIVWHILKYYLKESGHTKLCIAGGVAHNCTLNGKILYSGLFEDVFVQPAAHDAGCALGAALLAFHKDKPSAKPSLLEHVYLGTPLRDDDSIANTLSGWGDFLDFEKVENIARRTARLIADGAIVGWVQGRSEFGPRALGNRSIIADPRPAENKDIINEMVKKREAFRPFAPSVLQERVHEYFDVPKDKKEFPYMVFVVKVREEQQKLLGAITHVDGTARIQTVSRQTNSQFWELIHEFGDLTGIYVLLNTSFNNNAEPIVDSEQDAIVCFLTTKIHCLVLGDYLIRKKSVDYTSYLRLVISLPLYARIHQTRRFASVDEMANLFEVGNTYSDKYKVKISPELFDLLAIADGKRTLNELMMAQNIPAEKATAIIDEVLELWSNRLVRLGPRAEMKGSVGA